MWWITPFTRNDAKPIPECRCFATHHAGWLRLTNGWLKVDRLLLRMHLRRPWMDASALNAPFDARNPWKIACLEREAHKCLIFQHLYTMTNNVRPKTHPGYSFTLTTPAQGQSLKPAATSKEGKAIQQGFAICWIKSSHSVSTSSSKTGFSWSVWTSASHRATRGEFSCTRMLKR